jgi:putative PIN family toxin of toxin-antitoxin system
MRVVFDTNTLVSALLFKGTLSKLADLSKRGRIKPYFTRETFAEFRQVLHYPKFQLSESTINAILRDEIMPFFEVVVEPSITPQLWRDPDDDMFPACALAAGAAALITGDKDLLALRDKCPVNIIAAKEFLENWD